MTRFNLYFTVDVELSVAEIWPDGDAPENPTEEDVRTRFLREGSVFRAAEAWNLQPDDLQIVKMPT